MKVYVIWFQEYDYCALSNVITEDKFDEYIEYFKQRLIKENNNLKNPPTVVNMEVIKHKDQVNFRYTLDDEWTWNNYHSCEYFSDLTLEEMKERQMNIRTGSFSYDLMEINNF